MKAFDGRLTSAASVLPYVEALSQASRMLIKTIYMNAWNSVFLLVTETVLHHQHRASWRQSVQDKWL
ncbi:hypothetical protein M3J09_004607 [Ascochyta lentis]